MSKQDFGKWLEMQFLDWQRNRMRRSSVMSFAKYLDVNPVTLNSWLTQGRTPQGEHVEKLAKKLGREVYEVLGLEPPEAGLFFLMSKWDDLPEDVRENILRKAEGFAEHNEGKKQKKPSHAPMG